MIVWAVTVVPINGNLRTMRFAFRRSAALGLSGASRDSFWAWPEVWGPWCGLVDWRDGVAETFARSEGEEWAEGAFQLD